MDPKILQAVLDQLWPELPNLVGDAWPAIENTLAGYRHQLATNKGESASVQTPILLVLIGYSSAYRRLWELAEQYAHSLTKGVYRDVQMQEIAEAHLLDDVRLDVLQKDLLEAWREDAALLDEYLSNNNHEARDRTRARFAEVRRIALSLKRRRRTVKSIVALLRDAQNILDARREVNREVRIESPKTPGNITRYTDISYQSRIWVKTPRITVVVRLKVASENLSAATETLISLSEAPLQVQLSAPAFELLGSARQETPILPDRDSPALAFDLKPVHIGHSMLEFDFFQNGQPLRTVTVPIWITDQDELADASTYTRYPVTIPNNANTPDLLLRITWQSEHKGLGFELTYDGATVRNFGVVSLNDTVDEQVRRFYQYINSLVNRKDPTIKAQLDKPLGIPAEDIEHKIRTMSNELWDMLLPLGLRQFYAEQPERWRDRSLLIYSDEPYLPWELLWPPDDDGPWCVTTRMTRWLRLDAQGGGNNGPTPDVLLRSAAVLAPEYEILRNLPSATRERDIIKGLFAYYKVADISPDAASWRVVVNLLEGNSYDWIHIASHGSFYAKAPSSDSAIWLEQDRPLTPLDLGMRKITSHRPAFVFNACEAGRQGWALTRIGGWANRLVTLNASLFIGPLWNVNDVVAVTFSENLYRALLAGETIGKAVQQARLASRRMGDPTWLAYSVYAHPNARVILDHHT